jgi:hypothetical protein
MNIDEILKWFVHLKVFFVPFYEGIASPVSWITRDA